MLVWFLPLFLIFLLIGMPVFFSLLAAPGILLWLNGQARDAAMLYRNIYNGIDSFPLMAIPFFSNTIISALLFSLLFARIASKRCCVNPFSTKIIIICVNALL